MRVRIGRKGLAVYPPKVAAKLRIIAERFNIYTFEQKDELPTHKFHEVDSNAYFGMNADGASIPLGVYINNDFTMPAGTWLVEVDSYNALTVYHILEDEKEQKQLERDQALPLDNIRMALGRGFK